MSVKTDNKELNDRINSRNVHARIEERNYSPRFTGYVDLIQGDYEINRKKENTYIAILISIIFSLISLFLFSAIMHSFLTYSQQSRIDSIFIGVIVIFLFVFIKISIEPNNFEGAFKLDENDMNVSLICLYSSEQKRKELFYLFVEHFCNNFDISEYSNFLEISENNMEIKSLVIKKTVESMTRDLRYKSIINEELSNREAELL